MSGSAQQTWREIVRPIIAGVLRKLPASYGRKRKERALFGHYPFGQRRGWPYKVWRDEIRIQLGLRPVRPKTHSQLSDSPGQQRLFQ